eukprot:gene19437-25317_t
MLSAHGLKVWINRVSLIPGMNWEDGLSDGLVNSRVLIPIISRNSLNHPTNPRSNITLLDEDSLCDNVILEYELALELKERGDFDNDKGEYLDYFTSGCYPKDVKNVVVKSIVRNVINQLGRLGLGSRLVENDGLKFVTEAIIKSQGIVIKGREEDAFNNIINDLVYRT